MANEPSLPFDAAFRTWMERNKWGVAVFTAGAPITYWLARVQVGEMARYIPLDQIQYLQVTATLISGLIGAIVGGCGILVLWLLRRSAMSRLR